MLATVINHIFTTKTRTKSVFLWRTSSYPLVLSYVHCLFAEILKSNKNSFYESLNKQNKISNNLK